MADVMVPCFPGHMDSAASAFFVPAAQVARVPRAGNRALAGFYENGNLAGGGVLVDKVMELGAARSDRVSAIEMRGVVNLVVNREQLNRVFAGVALPAAVGFVNIQPADVGEVNDGYYGRAKTTLAMVPADIGIARLNGINWDVLSETVQVSVAFN